VPSLANRWIFVGLDLDRMRRGWPPAAEKYQCQCRPENQDNQHHNQE
jgi:hypothetical protein